MEMPDDLKRRGCGYTTGSCAAAAAKAATMALLGGCAPGHVQIDVPYGYLLCIGIEPSSVSAEVEYVSGPADVCDSGSAAEFAECAVRKYSGDDPDITDGILIFATVKKNETGRISVTGGKGIGRVTKPGLSVDVGEAAINPVPMQMIETEVLKVCEDFGYDGGLDVVISAPQGEEISGKTFNPRLGVVGGISILGTSGVVEPMSEKAITDTIYIELRQRAALGEKIAVVSPGNYGRDYMKSSFGIDIEKALKCGNHIGETIDYAAESGFQSILIVGHAGKLVKLAAGVMNTDSKVADTRMEVFALYAALCGAGSDLTRRILDCVTSDAAIGLLQESGLLEQVSGMITVKIEEHLERRAAGRLKVAAVIFTDTFGLFGKTSLANELLEEAREA